MCWHAALKLNAMKTFNWILYVYEMKLFVGICEGENVKEDNYNIIIMVAMQTYPVFQGLYSF